MEAKCMSLTGGNIESIDGHGIRVIGLIKSTFGIHSLPEAYEFNACHAHQLRRSNRADAVWPGTSYLPYLSI